MASECYLGPILTGIISYTADLCILPFLAVQHTDKQIHKP